MRLTNKLKKSLNIYFNKFKNIPNKGKKIGLFITIFLILVSYYFFVTSVHMDEVWNYGFIYNIANGLIPYKDFNMVILPFYQLMMALFFKIFGISLTTYHIVNGLIITSILYLVHKKIGVLNTFCLLFYLLLIPRAYGYNTFISIILILILYLEKINYKYKNIIIGLLVGSVLMTKINLGIFIFLPYFLISKHKIKSILFTMIIPISIFSYLLITNSLLECIDYCFLGLGKFRDNLFVSPFILFIEFLIILFFSYNLIKSKDKTYLYLMLFQFGCYPICDLPHFLELTVPVVFYLFLTYKNYYLKLALKTFCISLLVFISFIEIKNNAFYLSTRDNFLKYRVSSTETDYYLKEIENYVVKNSDKRIFIFSDIAYIIKININQKVDKFDLINRGNMGSNVTKYTEEIDKICEHEKCLFIINPNEFGKNSQLDVTIRDYILENYRHCEGLTKIYSVYCEIE